LTLAKLELNPKLLQTYKGDIQIFYPQEYPNSKYDFKLQVPTAARFSSTVKFRCNCGISTGGRPVGSENPPGVEGSSGCRRPERRPE